MPDTQSIATGSGVETASGWAEFTEQLQRLLAVYPRREGAVAVCQAPAVLDVMGGIAEQSGSLVLTAPLAFSWKCAAWRTAGDSLRLRRISQADGTGDLEVSLARLDPASGATPERIIASTASGDGEWALPALLAVHQALRAGVLSAKAGGWVLGLRSDFPEGADFARVEVLATAVLQALSKCLALTLDHVQKARLACDAVTPLVGLSGLRAPLTTLTAHGNGHLTQIRCLTPPTVESAALPDGSTVVAVRTQLRRPTKIERLIETRHCTEMGRQMIHVLRQQDGAPPEANGGHLAAVTPTEYVARFRDRMPSRITASAFVARFGPLRGVDGTSPAKAPYKVRSRAEHHIYENKRVHDFINHLIRAQRTHSVGPLVLAGEIMYASHWSHSQRCGIGGVEADCLINAIRERGPAAGLFGAKITGGGGGGEVVVLMKDTRESHQALAEAIRQAQASCEHPISSHRGHLAGAEVFEPPVAVA